MDQDSNSPQNIGPKLHGSMHKVYGLSIVILALVVAGIVCVMGDVQIPYLSALYAPAVPPPLIVEGHRGTTIGHQTLSGTKVSSSTNSTSSSKMLQ